MARSGPRSSKRPPPAPKPPEWQRRLDSARAALRWPLRLGSSALLLALGAAVLDGVIRDRIFADGRWTHHRAVFGIMLAAGVALATVSGLVLAAGRAAAWALSRSAPRVARWAPAVIAGTAVMLALAPAVFWVFQGRGFGGGALARFGPYAVVTAAGVGGAVLYVVVGWALGAVERGRERAALAIAAGLFAIAGGLAIVDLTAFVSLYARLHSAVELVAAIVWLAASLVVVTLIARVGPRVHRALDALGASALIWALAFFGGEDLRAWHAEVLDPVRREPVYAGRMVARLAYVDAAQEGEFGERAVTSRDLQALLDKYGIEEVARHPKWEAPFEEPAAVADAVRALRGSARDLNIVIYYVDTLRADVAYDPSRMPNVARFASASVRFDRAYSTGSDTLSSLPAIIGGSYDVRRPHARSVVETAREYGLAPTVFIPESAYEFLHKLMPSFEFDDAVRLSDYQVSGVWGYGADGPTAGPLVDSALSWMASRGDTRFFAWIFNFDVHNWRELEPGYLKFVAEQHGMVAEGNEQFDYDVSARGVDDAFGRLLDGLEELGLRDRTMVLFLSDHGEGLGYEGFWVHSVFLWEPLVKVPLVLSVPGLQPRSVGEAVSLVDVAPTLERFIVSDPTLSSYQGEDLMSYLVPERPPRRLPLLMVSTVQTKLARLGILDGRWKLVLPTDWKAPELYDLEAEDPDARDVSAEHPAVVLRLMSELVGAPTFASAHEDLLEPAEE